MLETVKDILLDTGKDTLEIIPVLLIAYLLMEFLEKHTSEKTNNVIRQSGRFGPIIGGLLGAFPQCGFSAAASSLYAGRVITVGTLLAVFLSTSDEMLPIFISENVPAGTIIKILAAKVIVGIIFGLITDMGVRIFRVRHHRSAFDDMDIEHFCEHEAAHEEEDGIFVSALKHTVKVTVFIFLVSLILNAIIEMVGIDHLSNAVINKPVVGEALAGLVGLVPNCAASVVITQLYLEGAIGSGPLMSGLLVGAGIGLLVLFRSNDNIKKNAMITALLYAAGVVSGIIIDVIGIAF